MEAAEYFLKRSKQRMWHEEKNSPHCVPRLNVHASSNSSTAKNVLEEILNSVGRKGLSHVSTYPIPVGLPVNVDDSIAKGVDPVLRLVKDKQQFKAMLETVRRSKNIKGLTLEDIENLSEIAEDLPVVNVHPSILALAQVCSLDPDPNFSCDYNNYYGGNLAATELQGRMAIVHSKQDEPSKVSVFDPDLDQDSSFDVSDMTHPAEDSRIYQVDCHSNLILLRQKRACGLFKFSFDEGTSLQKMGVVTTPEVFVSSCFNTFKQDEFATVSPNSAIEIHNVLGKSKRSVEVEGVKDNWGHVHYHDENVLMFTDRDSISLCDLRESGSDSLQWDFENQTDKCDNAFAAAKGKILHYVSTKHHLWSLDIRKGFHQRWAHGLSSAPCLLNVVSNETQSDAVLIGCQSSGGVVYVQSSPFGDFTTDILLPPIRLPSIRETLHLARTKECLLSPIISSRFSLSLTGLTSFKRSGKTQIFCCNSVGDLFAQSIRPTSQCDTLIELLSGSDLKRLSSWESRCLKHYYKANHEFKATDVISHQDLADLFEGRCELKDEPSASQVTWAGQPWNKSKKRLLSFQDVLAPKLLAPWNIEEDDEWCDVDETIEENEMTEESSDEQDVDTKVQAWLAKSVESVLGSADTYW